MEMLMRLIGQRARNASAGALLGRHDLFDVLDKAPTCLLVADDMGAIVFRNRVALALGAQVGTKRGEALVNAVHNGVAGQVRTAKSFPVTTTVAAQSGSARAQAEIVIDKVVGGFVISWADTTDAGDHERVLTSVAQELASTAESFIAFADQLTGAVGEVSEQADAVATGSNQLTDSIQEIASSAATAVGNTAAAVRSARSATDRVAQLSESSNRVGAVSRLISSIAGQTNLLALNATIEAARAGESGKGFAVVAGEVKSLAQRSGDATGDITSMIEAIQADSAAAAAALEEIVHAIALMDSEQTTIASAVEEQSMTAADIGARVAAVAFAARSSNTALAGLRAAAAVVAAKSNELRSLV
jgi:methyl-accepting chemotaxis protein